MPSFPAKGHPITLRRLAGHQLLGIAIEGATGRPFLDARTLRLALTPQRLASGEATIVGLGWRIGKDAAGRTIHHHGGLSNPGGRAMLVVWPAEQVVVAMLANIAASFDERDAGRLAAPFGGW